jgi:cell division protease FtsH
MLDEICATLGGRAAEELYTGNISSGALNDLETVTKRAYGMVAYLGMSDSLSNLCYYNNQEYGFTKPYSDSTAEKIDAEVSKLIQAQYERAKRLLSENAEKHAQLANLLCDKEVIFTEDVENIFGKRPWKSRADEILEAQEPTNDDFVTDRTDELEAVKQMIEEERKQAAAEDAQNAE